MCPSLSSSSTSADEDSPCRHTGAECVFLNKRVCVWCVSPAVACVRSFMVRTRRESSRAVTASPKQRWIYPGVGRPSRRRRSRRTRLFMFMETNGRATISRLDLILSPSLRLLEKTSEPALCSSVCTVPHLRHVGVTGGAGDRTRNLLTTRQPLYLLPHLASTFCPRGE